MPVPVSPAPAAGSAPIGDPPPVPQAAEENVETRYVLSLARGESDVRDAQRLRYDVFTGELGARLESPEPGLDTDAFDRHCDHLLVREQSGGDVVGTYRLLPPDRARAAGRLYAESEFDLSRLDPVRHELVEVGRSCVHPRHRNGLVIGLIWGGIARYMVEGGYEYLAGCCSLPLTDGGAAASATWEAVRARHLAPEEFRVTPLRLWTPRPASPAQRAELPPLLRGYLRLGAWVCGAPAYDPDFGVADVYVVLAMRRTNPRYLRHWLSLGLLGPAVRQ
jgi:putative hemolysin